VPAAPLLEQTRSRHRRLSTSRTGAENQIHAETATGKNSQPLSEAGYIERCEGLRDRRTGRLKLTEKGLSLRHDLRDLDLAQVRAMKRLGHDADKIQATLDLLMDLERIQANVCHL
jgi:hypothetical protein